MQAVLEEIEADVASFIPDDRTKTKYVNIKDLPVKQDNLKIGGLYELTVGKNGRVSNCRLLNSKQSNRKKRIKNKREQLLNRKK